MGSCNEGEIGNGRRPYAHKMSLQLPFVTLEPSFGAIHFGVGAENGFLAVHHPCVDADRCLYHGPTGQLRALEASILFIHEGAQGRVSPSRANTSQRCLLLPSAHNGCAGSLDSDAASLPP